MTTGFESSLNILRFFASGGRSSASLHEPVANTVRYCADQIHRLWKARYSVENRARHVTFVVIPAEKKFENLDENIKQRAKNPTACERVINGNSFKFYLPIYESKTSDPNTFSINDYIRIMDPISGSGMVSGIKISELEKTDSDIRTGIKFANGSDAKLEMTYSSVRPTDCDNINNVIYRPEGAYSSATLTPRFYLVFQCTIDSAELPLRDVHGRYCHRYVTFDIRRSIGQESMKRTTHDMAVDETEREVEISTASVGVFFDLNGKECNVSMKETNEPSLLCEIAKTFDSEVSKIIGTERPLLNYLGSQDSGYFGTSSKLNKSIINSVARYEEGTVVDKGILYFTMEINQLGLIKLLEGADGMGSIRNDFTHSFFDFRMKWDRLTSEALTAPILCRVDNATLRCSVVRVGSVVNASNYATSVRNAVRTDVYNKKMVPLLMQAEIDNNSKGYSFEETNERGPNGYVPSGNFTLSLKNLSSYSAHRIVAMIGKFAFSATIDKQAVKFMFYADLEATKGTKGDTKVPARNIEKYRWHYGFDPLVTPMYDFENDEKMYEKSMHAMWQYRNTAFVSKDINESTTGRPPAISKINDRGAINAPASFDNFVAEKKLVVDAIDSGLTPDVTEDELRKLLEQVTEKEFFGKILDKITSLGLSEFSEGIFRDIIMEYYVAAIDREFSNYARLYATETIALAGIQRGQDSERRQEILMRSSRLSGMMKNIVQKAHDVACGDKVYFEKSNGALIKIAQVNGKEVKESGDTIASMRGSIYYFNDEYTKAVYLAGLRDRFNSLLDQALEDAIDDRANQLIVKKPRDLEKLLKNLEGLKNPQDKNNGGDVVHRTLFFLKSLFDRLIEDKEKAAEEAAAAASNIATDNTFMSQIAPVNIEITPGSDLLRRISIAYGFKISDSTLFTADERYQMERKRRETRYKEYIRRVKESQKIYGYGGQSLRTILGSLAALTDAANYELTENVEPKTIADLLKFENSSEELIKKNKALMLEVARFVTPEPNALVNKFFSNNLLFRLQSKREQDEEYVFEVIRLMRNTDVSAEMLNRLADSNVDGTPSSELIGDVRRFVHRNNISVEPEKVGNYKFTLRGFEKTALDVFCATVIDTARAAEVKAFKESESNKLFELFDTHVHDGRMRTIFEKISLHQVSRMSSENKALFIDKLVNEQNLDIIIRQCFETAEPKSNDELLEYYNEQFNNSPFLVLLKNEAVKLTATAVRDIEKIVDSKRAKIVELERLIPEQYNNIIDTSVFVSDAWVVESPYEDEEEQHNEEEEEEVEDEEEEVEDEDEELETKKKRVEEVVRKPVRITPRTDWYARSGMFDKDGMTQPIRYIVDKDVAEAGLLSGGTSIMEWMRLAFRGPSAEDDVTTKAQHKSTMEAWSGSLARNPNGVNAQAFVDLYEKYVEELAKGRGSIDYSGMMDYVPNPNYILEVFQNCSVFKRHAVNGFIPFKTLMKIFNEDTNNETQYNQAVRNFNALKDEYLLLTSGKESFSSSKNRIYETRLGRIAINQFFRVAIKEGRAAQTIDISTSRKTIESMYDSKIDIMAFVATVVSGGRVVSGDIVVEESNDAHETASNPESSSSDLRDLIHDVPEKKHEYSGARIESVLMPTFGYPSYTITPDFAVAYPNPIYGEFVAI